MEKYLLRLYPYTWRERYGDELLAMLEPRSLSFADGVNLFIGALDAHLHPHLGTTGMQPHERFVHLFVTLRRSLLSIFCAYACFIIAGLAFQKLTESSDFQEVVRVHSMVGLSFHLVVIGAIVALLAALAGGLPIAIALMRRAFVDRQGGILFLLAVPVLACTACIGVVLFLKTMNPLGTQLAWQLLFSRGLFVGTLLLASIVSLWAVCFAVVRSKISEKVLRFALLPSFLTILAMTLIEISTIAWGFALRDGAPWLFSGNDGIVSTPTILTWLGIVIAMGITTLLAVLSLIRGLAVRSALRDAAVSNQSV